MEKEKKNPPRSVKRKHVCGADVARESCGKVLAFKTHKRLVNLLGDVLTVCGTALDSLVA